MSFDARRAVTLVSAGRTMSATSELFLPFDDDDRSGQLESDRTTVRLKADTTMVPLKADTTTEPDLPDAVARAAAIDSLQNVALEASAGRVKTRVLVDRYVNQLRAGVDPDHILAITFTRKAAAGMRQRIIGRLKE